MDNQSQDKLYTTALQTIGAVAKLPIVRVDREAFIRKHFGSSPHLDVILERGPQAVYTVESLRKKADSLIKNSVTKTSVASFATGLPGNPAVAIAAGGADVAQYFGFCDQSCPAARLPVRRGRPLRRRRRRLVAVSQVYE